MFKIMTYNVQHCRDYNRRPDDIIDFDVIASPVLAEKPDILCLNEVMNNAESRYGDQPAEIGKRTGMMSYFARAICFGDVAYGNTVLSRQPFTDTKTVPIPDPNPHHYDDYYETRCVAVTRTTADGKPLCVITVHMGLNLDERENAVSTLLDILSEIDAPVVLTGDFNAHPDAPELKPLFTVLHNAAEEQNATEYTFPSDAPEETIDYILYRGLTPKCVKAVQGVYSDHLPVVAEFEF